MGGMDLWGSIIPAWLGGVGGLAAAVVGTIALIKSLKTQGGVDTLKSAANASHLASPVEGQIPKTSGSESSNMSPVSWTAWREARSRYRLRNDSTQTSASAKLVGFKDVTPDGDNAANYPGPLPVQLAANESVPFTIERSMASPSVTAIELRWVDRDGTERVRTLYV